MARSKEQEATLHDWLRLGEVELALSPEAQNGQDEMCRRRDQIHRLPLMLRLLAGSRPLSSIPSIPGDEESDTVEGGEADSLIDGVVSRLEDVTATCAEAEGVDVLVSSLAPTLGRKIGKLPPLKRVYNAVPGISQRGNWEGLWETRELAMVLAAGPPNKKRRIVEHPTPQMNSNDEIVAEEDEGDEMMVDKEGGVRDRPDRLDRVGSAASNEDEGPKDLQSFLVGAAVAAEDSQESMVVRTLSEITSLVVASLKPIATPEDDSDDKSHGNIALSVLSDSLLSEPGPTRDSMESVGAIGGSDLGATIVALMHHAPVLRHRHVANGLCRTATPQAADLIARMAANCPAASSCLVQGCIDAYRSANGASESSSGGLATIATLATSAVRSIAELSPQEAGRVLASLQKSGDVMVDLMLELCISDAAAVASLLVKHLTAISRAPYHQSNHSTANATRNLSRRRIRAAVPSRGPCKLLSLHMILQGNPSLVNKLCQSLLEEVKATSDKVPSWGRTALLLRAYALLMLRVGLPAQQNFSESTLSRTQSAESFISGLLDLGDKVFTFADSVAETRPTSEVDRCFQLLLCSWLLTGARFAPSVGCKTDTGSYSDYMETLWQRLHDSSISHTCDVFASRVAVFFLKRNVTQLYNLICSTVEYVSNGVGDSAPVEDQLKEGFDTVCGFAQEKLELESVSRRGISEAAILEDTSALIASIQHGIINGSFLRDFVQNLFRDPLKCEALLAKDGAGLLIEESELLLSKEPGPKVPLVLPIDLESLASVVEWPENSERVKLGSLGCQFLLQLQYCLCFLERNPKSPFVVDPRNLPLKEALVACEILLQSHVGSATASFSASLKEKIFRQCGELGPQTEILPISSNWGPSQVFDEFKDMQQHKLSDMVSAAIRACQKGKAADPSGAAAERAFLIAQAHLDSTLVDPLVVGALLSTPNSPPPYFTNAMLCRDPIVLLKCPLSVWKCRGLRRIALNILSRLLESNRRIIKQMSPTEETAAELLVARNTVVVRCLVIAASGSSVAGSANRVHPFYCSSTLTMVRMLVARQRGIVAMLVKQDIPEDAMDWIVEFVPESIEDAEALRVLLSDRSSLTAAERLKVADAALRIAIAHGSARDESHAQTLVYSALSVMVSSFFLVVGPVGVPVNVLCEEGGLDVTQVCRKVMFRMLSALQKVNGRIPGIRNECTMALQKIAGLCKGETIMSGVAGVVATRRKNLLKEIWDAVVKAINAMGGGTLI